MASDPCEGPLQFADPDVEQTLRKQIGNPTQPLYALDFKSVTVLSFLGNPATDPCPTAPDCPIPESPTSDGWVTSLSGLECLPHLQELELDAWYVPDFSPLAAISELTTLKVFFSAKAHFPALPQLRELRVWNSDGDLAALGAMRNLTSFTGHFKDLSGKKALLPLRAMKGLRALVISGSQITDVTGLEGLTELVSVDLSRNDIDDLSPLLRNAAFGSNTTLDIRENPITCADASVLALVARNVRVEPCSP